MAPRASWKGYLKLSLVSCSIALYPAASTSERVSFNRINKKTGNRLKQQLIDAETGETVEREDIGRGYELGKGQYLQVEDEEIEKIRIESSHAITIDTFVPRPEIDDRYLDSPYYLAPTDKVGQEAFAVIRDAIRDKGMVALGRVVVSRREHVMMLEAFDKGLLATILRYSYEVRDQAGPPPRHQSMDALRASIGGETKKKPAAASTKARAHTVGKTAKRKTGR
jgi:DNA end-binding protein Ku